MKYFLSAVLLLFVSTTLFSQPVKNFQPLKKQENLKGKIDKIEITLYQGYEVTNQFTQIYNQFCQLQFVIGTPDTFYIYEYDENGNLLKYIDKRFNSIISYELDKNNNMIKECEDDDYVDCTEYEWIGNKLAKKDNNNELYYVFNEKGLMIEEKYGDIRFLDYNDKNLITKEIVKDSKLRELRSTIYEYNKNNDLIKYIESDHGSGPISYTVKYVYDKKDNWISKDVIEEKSKKNIFSTSRKITYKEELPAAKSKTKKK